MANKGVKQSTRGNLNKDVDPKAMRNGDYEDALDVLHINKGSNKSLNAEPTLGNKYAFTIEPRVAQNKRIRFNIPTQANYEATVFKTDGVTPLFSFFFSNPTDFTVNFAVGAGAAGLQINFVETTSTFVTVEILTPAYYDWFVSSVGGVEFTFDVLQEALSPNYIGIPKIIGSVDLLGNLFVFSTTKTQEQRDFTITDIYNSGGRIGISTAEPHGLQNGFEVNISGTQIDRYADGLWIVQVINASSFILQLSDASTLNLSAPVTGTVSVYVRGYGEIGVAVKDLNTDSWQYTRLLGSKEFNFDTFHLIECRAEANNLGKSLYFNQVKKDKTKVFYYNQPTYIQDGGLSINGGKYEYGNIQSETYLTLKFPAPIFDLFSINDTSGNLKSGYKRYSIRYLDIFNTPTNWSDICPPVAIFSEYQTAEPYKIMGDPNDTATTKAVTMKITNIPSSDTYDNIEIAVVEYNGLSISSYILKQQPIERQGNAIFFTHTGFETNIQTLDVSEIALNSVNDFFNVGSICILDNRLIEANYEPNIQDDFSPVFANVKHSIKRKELDSVGRFDNVKYGEYMKPENIYYNRGYMLNETYRFGGRLVFKDGTKSDFYFIDDIIFDANPTNSASKKPNNRISTIPDYTLTTFELGNVNNIGNGTSGIPDIANYNLYNLNIEDIVQGKYAAYNKDVNAYCFYVEFENFNLNFFDKKGRSIKEIVDFIEIGVCPCIKEVLASGVMLPANENTIPPPTFYYPYTASNASFSGLPARQISINPTNIRYPDMGSLLIPDYFLGIGVIDFSADDIIYNYGRPCLQYTNFSDKTIDEFYGVFESVLNTIVLPTGLVPTVDDFGVLNGYVSFQSNINSPFSTHNVKELKTVGAAAEVSFTSVFPTRKYYGGSGSATGLGYELNTMYAVLLEQQIDLLGYTIIDYNTLQVPQKQTSFVHTLRRDMLRQFQYLRRIKDKYGDIKLSKFLSTYSFLKIKTDDNNSTKVAVFGGDTYTQKSYFKYFRGFDGSQSVKGGIIGFYSQNRNNIQMRFRAIDQAVYPNGSGTTANDRVQDCLDKEETRQIASNYLIQSEYFVFSAYNPTNNIIREYKTRIAYSALKPQNSIIDYYRSFPPFQYYDLDPQYGEITHIEVLNNELYAWQERKVNRMFFNTTGVLTTVEGDISVLGNQGVLSRKPIALSAFGTKHKFSVVKGTSAGGQDVAYWINSESNMLMRFGADGSVAISILWGLMGFLNDNLKWAQQNLKYTGNRYGYGIYGVWDERFKEAIFTVRAAKDVDDWQIRQSYTANRSNFSVVRNYNQVQFSTFEESPDIFICTQDHTATADTEPGVGVNWQSYWVVAPHTDNNYYNEYTIALNEIKNGFSTFYTHKPAIYMRYRNKFLTAHPKMKYSNASFEHREGEYLTWYNYEGEEQTSTGYIMPIINIDPEAIKWYLAVWMVTKFAPFRMEFYTDKHESYLDAEDFEEREGVWISNIKNDLDNITQRNDLDTSQLYGSYLKVKIFFEPKKFQQFFDFVTLLRLSQRSYIK